MHRRDEIDAALAKHFAWTFVAPADTARLKECLRAAEGAIAAVRTAPTPAHTGPLAATDAAVDQRLYEERADERSRTKAKAGCRALAAAVAEAWASADDAARLQSVKRLLARADRLGVELLEMGEWPAEAVRLLRLFVRYAPKLTRRQRERCASVATLVPLDHGEGAELLVEVAQAGDRVMADALLADDEWAPDVADEASLVARLADVVDEAPSHGGRVIAIELIGRCDQRSSAVAALKRALRLPSFAVRAHALHTLATWRPGALSPENLVQVLRDLVEHAVPDALACDEHEDNERIFAEAVLAALEHTSPEEAAEALLDWIDADRDALWLDPGWATEALAVAFPETAAAMVDHWLKRARAHDRTRALAALQRLPDELARPRVELAASDPSPAVRESARQQWLQRFGVVYAVRPEALVGATLLEGPPSERFLARLLVIHGRVPEARQAMARALLAEAPDREALVLLLQFVGDDAVSSEPVAQFHGPDDEDTRKREWAALIVQRFGGAGVEGMCALATRFPEPESFGWMRRLGDLLERGAIPSDQAASLRALAVAHVESEDAAAFDDSIRLLSLVGAPPELLDRVVGLALDVELGSSAARELVVAWPDRAVDARLTSQMALAVAERDWLRVQRTASLALGRGSGAARVIAQRVLEIADEDAAAVDAAVECAARLRTLGLLDDAWALSALGRPDSPLFTVAARAWRKSPAIRHALEAALASPGRAASRAEAAISLLWGEPPLSPRDRRLSAILATAPVRERAELVHTMCIHGAPFAQVAAHLEGLLTSPDPVVTQALIGIGHWLRSSKGQALLRGALPRIVDLDLRGDIEEELGTPETSYWVEG